MCGIASLTGQRMSEALQFPDPHQEMSRPREDGEESAIRTENSREKPAEETKRRTGE
jgi:hypothetical protein